MKHAPTLLFLLIVGLAFVLFGAWPTDERVDSSHAAPPASRGAAMETRSSNAEELAEPDSVRLAMRSVTAPGPLAVRTLRGQVLAADGRSLAAASVLVIDSLHADPESAPVLERGGTGADGRFELELPPDAKAVAILVDAPGYREALVSVADDEDMVVVLQPRQRSVTVVGRVMDAGRLVPQFEVREYVLANSEARTGLDERWTTVQQTADGFTHLLATWGAKEAQFAIRARGFLETMRAVSTIGGERVDLGVIELVQSTNRVGFVVDPTGAPIGGAVVHPLFVQGDHGIDAVSAMDDGRFEIAALEGREPEALFVSAPSFAPQLVRKDAVGGTWNSVVVQLEPGARIEGRVTQADGTPESGATLRAWLGGATGSELPGGAQGSTVWMREARTNAAGGYVFENVPSGTVTVGVTKESLDESVCLRRLRTLEVTEARLGPCDFTLGGGHSVRGALEFPIRMRQELLCLELLALRGGERRVVASVEVPPTEPFVFHDAEWDPALDELVLRISVAPGFHVDRSVVARGPDGDLGVIRFPDPKSLLEFNRGDRRVFQVVAGR